MNPALDAEALAHVAEHGSVRKASEATGIPRTTLTARAARARAHMNETAAALAAVPQLTFPEFPEEMGAAELVEHLSSRFRKAYARQKAEKWFTIAVDSNDPIGLAFIGDPHVDSDGCNWPLLVDHCKIMKDTPGIFGVSMGDLTDNWVGRLARLYANNPTTRADAIKLADWLISESGIRWMALIRGNHDMWSPGRDDPVTWMKRGAGVPMVDWQAQFRVTFPNGAECKVDARHDFKGHSMWNSLHAMQKAAHMKEEAHIYVAGHKHNYALHQEESASRDFTYWLLRARGYKFIDEYSTLLGHDEQVGGATVLAVIDPTQHPRSSRFIHCFADLAAGADYLTFMRGRK